MQKELNVNAVIGYKGSVQQGLILHPDNEHIIYSLGSTVVVRNIVTRTQEFLRGHDNEISCITVSPSGRYIASGQRTHMGFQADICVWDFESMTLLYRLRLHKVMIQSLSFSFNEKYLASLGGEDDKSNLIIWDVATGKAAFGSPLGTKTPVVQAKFFNEDEQRLIAISQTGILLVTIEAHQKKVLLEVFG